MKRVIKGGSWESGQRSPLVPQYKSGMIEMERPFRVSTKGMGWDGLHFK